MSKNLTRVLVALLLMVTLTAGAAQAAPWSLAGPEPSRSFAAAFWGWIVSWFETSASEEGCGMDPNGVCRSGATTSDPNV